MCEGEGDNTCVINRLMTEGNYEIILVKIFLFLDGKSLTACAKVVRNRRREDFHFYCRFALSGDISWWTIFGGKYVTIFHGGQYMEVSM